MKLSLAQLSLWLRWIALTTIGGVSGLLITMILPLDSLFFIGSYTLASVLACMGQWLLLDKLINARKGWIATGLAGLITPIVLLMTATQLGALAGADNPLLRYLLTYLGVGIGGLLTGLLLGNLQRAAVLQRCLEETRGWTLATGLAWGFGWAIGTTIPGIDPPTANDPVRIIIGWLVSWIIIGAITGGMLLYLLPSKREQSVLAKKEIVQENKQS
jgi:hypothetical protein